MWKLILNTLVASSLGLLGFHYTLAQTTSPDLPTKFRRLADTTTWLRVAAIPLAFPAHHPQGMVKIGPYFYMSSVEVLDRAAGKGTGHLFKFDAEGTLLADVRLGEGAMYHPGGIDYDGENIWVPVAEYRPNSHSIVYKVDPKTLKSTEVFRFDDHVGGIVHDTDSHTLHGISWGSRTFYEWPLESDGKIGEIKSPKVPGTPNPSYYIDYQDCHYAGNYLMLCGGVKNYKNGSSLFKLGGLELVNLADYRPVHQVPLALWSPSGRPMTQNPFWLESIETGLRAYFVPDDDAAMLFIYETQVK
jgi:hypothetical protein